MVPRRMMPKKFKEKTTSVSRFRFELSDFRFVFTKKLGKALRLTQTWILDSPEWGRLGQCIPGCMVVRDNESKLRFSLPMSFRSRVMGSFTSDLHDLIVDIIENKTRFGKFIGAEIPGFMRSVDPQSLDPNLPENIQVSTEVEHDPQEKTGD
jgi:hypothetical protein